MAKRNHLDAPGELKKLYELFMSAAYSHSPEQVFTTWLYMLINAVSFDFTKERDEHMKLFPEKHWDKFRELFHETFLTFQRIILNENRTNHVLSSGDGWYDMFGAIYEASGMINTKERAGQFFTPPTVVDFMTQINFADFSDLPKDQITVMDPACGSGRYSISAHTYMMKKLVKKYGMVTHLPIMSYAQDIDKTCCLMTLMNMYLHGCRGEVIWGDTLRMEVIEAYAIKSDKITGIPIIHKLKKEDSIVFQHHQEDLIKALEKRVDTKEEAVSINSLQGELFT